MAHILICDDEVHIANILKFQIESAGHRCMAVNFAKEALFWAADTEFDFIITDVKMPQWNGLDLVKALVDVRDCKIAVVTAYSEEAISQEIKDFPNVCAVIKKPWDRDKLLELIEEHCAVKE